MAPTSHDVDQAVQGQLGHEQVDDRAAEGLLCEKRAARNQTKHVQSVEPVREQRSLRHRSDHTDWLYVHLRARIFHLQLQLQLAYSSVLLLI
jgi:hypothetical protein